MKLLKVGLSIRHGLQILASRGTDVLKVKTGEAIIKFGESNIQKYVIAVDKGKGEINILRLGSH